MTGRLLRLLAALFATMLLLGACGDDSGDGGTPAAPAAGDADGGDADAGDADSDADGTGTAGGDDDDAADDTVEGGSDDGGSDDGGSDEGGSDEGASGGSPVNIGGIDNFCELWEFGEDSDDVLFDFGSGEGPPTDEEIAQARSVAAAVFGRGVQLAPDEIRGDFQMIATAAERLFDLLADYDYDFFALGMAAEGDAELAAEFDSVFGEELDEASDRVDAWVETNC